MPEIITREHMADPGSASLKRFTLKFSFIGIKDAKYLLPKQILKSIQTFSLVWYFLGVILYSKCGQKDGREGRNTDPHSLISTLMPIKMTEN